MEIIERQTTNNKTIYFEQINGKKKQISKSKFLEIVKDFQMSSESDGIKIYSKIEITSNEELNLICQLPDDKRDSWFKNQGDLFDRMEPKCNWGEFDGDEDIDEPIFNNEWVDEGWVLDCV